MRPSIVHVVCALAAFLVVVPPTAGASDVGLDKLAALVGSWQGQRTDGVQVSASYEVLAGGSAVVEKLDVGDHPTMLTVYYADGGEIRLTHFCMAGNQPRMSAAAIGPQDRAVRFEYVDATNLASATAGHMHNLEITFLDRDHIGQRWTWLEDGKTHDSVFALSRVSR